MIETAPQVAIVVVNYRTPDDTIRCVRSLLDLDYSNFRIVVVDNASSDGSAARLKEELPPSVQFIEADRNGGYTSGNNLGIRAALRSGAEFVHLLNPDTVVIHRGYLCELVRHMAEHPSVGISGPRVHLGEIGRIQDTVLRFPWIWRSLAHWFRDRLLGPVNLTGDTVHQVEALNGVCVLIRRACLEQVGMLDEGLFAYVEDVEFAARCRKTGWHLHYVPVDSVLHLQKQAGYELDSAVSFLLKRNTVYFLMRSGHAVQAFGFIFLSLVLCLLRSCASLGFGQVRRARRFLRFAGLLARSYVLLLDPRRRALGMGPPPQALTLRRGSINVGSRRDRKKLCIVSQVPTPYREPLFERLANQPNVDLKVFYFTEGVRGVAWRSDSTAAKQQRGYACEVLPNFIPKCFIHLPVLGYVNCSIVTRLAAERPHYVVVYGYNFVTQFLAIAYCWWTSTPYALRSDSNGFCEPTIGWAHQIKRRALRYVVKNAHAVLCVGSANRRYWEIYGALPRQLLEAPYAVDTAWLSLECARRTADAAQSRKQLGWTGKCLFLFAGRLVSEKGVDALIDAMKSVCDARPDAALVLVGDGPLRESLARRIGPRTAHLIHFVGQASYAEMAMYYAMADVLVLPSRHEAWGLVINEAMLCGLPVIATSRCGATHDLLLDGRCGLRVEHSSAAGLEQAMLWMLQHPEARRAMGQFARAWASQWSFDRTVRGFLAALAGGNAALSDPSGWLPQDSVRAA